MAACIDQLALRAFLDVSSDAQADATTPPEHVVAGQTFEPIERSKARGMLNERRRNTVLELIEQSLESGATGEQLAASVGLSKGAFHRAFKATFGVTPFRYLTKRRVEAAVALMMDTSLNLGAIAAQSGFYDQAHLCRQFRKAFGESPTHWRGRHKKRSKRRYVSA